MSDKHTPINVSKDEKDQLLKVETIKINDDIGKMLAKKRLYSAADALGVHAKGYKHTGSAAVHFYFSELVGPAHIVQIQMGRTAEYVAIMGSNKFIKQLMESYGHEIAQKK